MALTRAFKQTVKARAERDSAFRNGDPHRAHEPLNVFPSTLADGARIRRGQMGHEGLLRDAGVTAKMLQDHEVALRQVDLAPLVARQRRMVRGDDEERAVGIVLQSRASDDVPSCALSGASVAPLEPTFKE
jgi:hypothetical protein